MKFIFVVGFFGLVHSVPQSEFRSKRNAADLVLALTIGSESEAKRIIESGVDVNYEDESGWSLLHRASFRGFDDVVQMLIDRKADVNIRNNKNSTPLHLAAFKGRRKIAEILIANKADINAKNSDGKTPYDLAVQFGFPQIVKLIDQTGSKTEQKINTGFSQDLPEFLKLIDQPATKFQQNSNTDLPDYIKLIERPASRPYQTMNTVAGLPDFLKKHIRAPSNSREKIHSACEKYSKKLPTNFILGGDPAEVGEFPWMVSLGYLNLDEKYSISFDCGGTLISDRFILTAAHCIREVPKLVLARLGKTDLRDQGANSYYIKNVIKHPNFSPITKKNDIALIELSESIEFTSDIRPACLETNLKDENEAVWLYVTGWGSTAAESQSIQSDQLLKAQVTTVPLSECNATFVEYNEDANHEEFLNGISESQYCAHNSLERSDSCYGDSGGPLQVFRNLNTAHILGITSFGVSCGTLPAVYTRVAYYSDWISAHVWPNA